MDFIACGCGGGETKFSAKVDDAGEIGFNGKAAGAFRYARSNRVLPPALL